MVFSILEIVDIVVMSVIVGVIFSKLLQRYGRYSDPLKSFDWETFKLAVLVTAPAIILHEFGHKFVALGFGMQAEFNAAYGWLFIGLLLALMNTGIIFFVPAYVSIFGAAMPWQFSIIAFAGPLVNLVLWLGSAYLIKQGNIKPKNQVIWYLTKQINKWLFIFNMLPIPGFDGFQVYAGIIAQIF